MKKSEEKTEVQRFFDQVRLYDIDTDFGLIEEIFGRKYEIRDGFSEYLIKETENHIKKDDSGTMIKKSFLIGYEPESPTNNSEYAVLQIKTTFLKELEFGGIIDTLDFYTEAEEPFGRFAKITFYPYKFIEYLKENKGTTNFGKKIDEFYITKEGEDFKYNNLRINKPGKNTQSYIVFDVLYTLLPEGGFVKYEDISKELKKRLSKTKDLGKEKIQKFIIDRLDKNNGFIRSAKINNLVAGGKKLIEVNKGEGIVFNNKKR